MALPKKARNFRLAYGLALESGGITSATKFIGSFLDDDDEEVFGEFYPNQEAFKKFSGYFLEACERQILAYGWKLHDKDLLKKGLKMDTSLKAYYHDNFVKAIG